MTNEPPGQTPAMLTVNETCAALGIGRTQFYKLVNSGELQAVNVSPGAPKRRVGEPGRRRSIRVPQSEIDAFLERNKLSA